MISETASDVATRPWRVRGYDKQKKIRYEKICRGDRALDETLKYLEASPLYVRITVEPTW